MSQTSLSAGQVDTVFWTWVGVSALFLAGITAVMIGFVVRYARGRPQGPGVPAEGAPLLEVLWTLVPTAVFLLIFYHGWTDYGRMRNPPRDALAVGVTARQWAWSFRYPNGKETARLYAPVNRPVRLEVRSADVIHGLFVPAFRLKVDAVPGHHGKAWFQAVRMGRYELMCTVICGIDHSRMNTEVVVVAEPAFRAWYFGGEDAPEPAPPEHPGLAALRARGCLACHSLDGAPGVGPTFRGGLLRDEARRRRAIVDPDHEPLPGYPPVMPSGPMEPKELDAILAYLRALP